MWHNFDSNNESSCFQPCRPSLALVTWKHPREPQTSQNTLHSNNSYNMDYFPKQFLHFSFPLQLKKIISEIKYESICDGGIKAFKSLTYLSLNFHIPGLFYNRLLLLVLLFSSPNRERFTEISGYFSTFYQAILSF